jgi:hypothetical protein
MKTWNLRLEELEARIAPAVVGNPGTNNPGQEGQPGNEGEGFGVKNQGANPPSNPGQEGRPGDEGIGLALGR